MATSTSPSRIFRAALRDCPDRISSLECPLLVGSCLMNGTRRVRFPPSFSPSLCTKGKGCMDCAFLKIEHNKNKGTNRMIEHAPIRDPVAALGTLAPGLVRGIGASDRTHRWTPGLALDCPHV